LAEVFRQIKLLPAESKAYWGRETREVPAFRCTEDLRKRVGGMSSTVRTLVVCTTSNQLLGFVGQQDQTM